MFGINFSEWALIAVVAFIVIGPKELPVVVRHLAAFIRELRTLTAGLRAQFHEVAREAGFDDVMHEMREMHRHTTTTTIIDLEGKPQKAYDIRELKALETTAVPAEPVAETPKTPHQAPTYPRADHE